jgi:hypothetical protein
MDAPPEPLAGAASAAAPEEIVFIRLLFAGRSRRDEAAWPGFDVARGKLRGQLLGRRGERIIPKLPRTR